MWLVGKSMVPYVEEHDVSKTRDEKIVPSDNSLSFRSQYPILNRNQGDSEQTNFVSVQCFGVYSVKYYELKKSSYDHAFNESSSCNNGDEGFLQECRQVTLK